MLRTVITRSAATGKEQPGEAQAASLEPPQKRLAARNRGGHQTVCEHRFEPCGGYGGG